MNFRTALLGTAIALAPAITSAATLTTFDVTDNPGGTAFAPEFGIADETLFGQTMTIGDSVSVSINGMAGDTDGSLGFSFMPEPLDAGVSISLSASGGVVPGDFDIFGDMDIHLSTTADIAGSFASLSITTPGIYNFDHVALTSPVYVIFDWTNDVTGSFNADVGFAQVPVPAGILLMGTALASLGVARRRRRKAA